MVLLSRNTDFFVEALIAVLTCGAVAVPLNVKWTAKEVSAALELCQPVIILCEPRYFALLQKVSAVDYFLYPPHEQKMQKRPKSALPSQVIFNILQVSCQVVCLGQSSKVAQRQACTEEMISANKGAAWRVTKPVNDLAMIVFTSGTTGPAKGVCLTHACLAFQVCKQVKRQLHLLK